MIVERADVLKILKDRGFNYIRLRVFVNPGDQDGYAATSKETFCDLAHTQVMAKRVKDAGMGLLVNFHYSDNWADLRKQATPLAWQKLDLEGLKQAVHDHTRSVLMALKKQGTLPEMVQIGNEVSNGMLWPTGSAKEHFDQFVELLKAGAAATREVDPGIKIIMHYPSGKANQAVRAWLDHLIAEGVDFDIIGLSCNSDGPVKSWKENIDDLAVRYPQYGLIAAEYSYKKRELNDIIYNAPDRRGLGSFIWEPTRHHEAIFDQRGENGEEPPAAGVPGHHPRSGKFEANGLMELYSKMAKDYRK